MKKLILFLILLSVTMLFRRSTLGQNNHTLYLPIISNPFPEPTIDIEIVLRGLSDIHTDIETSAAGDVYIATHTGIVSRIKSDGTLESPPFLDISSAVETDRSELGFYDVAFHPDYATNQYFYVSYFHRDPTTERAYLRVSRFVAIDETMADRNSETIILEIEQFSKHHKGGTLIFSPINGYLFIAVGDDADGLYSQDEASLKGKILRIDVDSADPYAIPPDNPFVGNPEVQDEIWAMGLRNPWAIYIDPVSGDFYIPDVGLSAMEELNFQPHDDGGGQNYGWPCLEGTRPFVTSACDASDTLTAPVHTYTHANDRCSIAGGLVYHGDELPELQGKYLFADFCTYEIFTLERIATDWQVERIGFGRRFITKFGTDADGEILLAYFVHDIIDKIVPIEPTQQ